MLDYPPVGGFTRRDPPAAGLRPTVLFTVASLCTLAWVSFAVWVSEPWRDDLERALGPVMGWLIPILLAYIPGIVIGGRSPGRLESRVAQR